MSAAYHLTAPLSVDDTAKLRSGDMVFLSGTIYAARDAAHKRLFDLLDQGEPPPFPLEGAVIFYVGPSPPPPGHVIGSAGPTTSYRMDSYAPRLHELGVKATIGKGLRSQEVKESLQKTNSVYFGATGGAGALLSSRIIAAEVIAFPDLGPEAIRRLTVKDFPLLVINDSRGNELYARPSIA